GLQRHGRRGFAGRAVLPSGRRPDDLGECHDAHDQAVANHGRAFARRPCPGGDAVQHVFRRHLSSSAADVAVLTRTLAPEMDREGYDRAFTAALIASAATMANLIPPSIMAVVYGATGNVSIGGLFLGGVVPGVLVGIGLMIYSHFFGPIGFRRKRATFGAFAGATKRAAIPLMIPVIIMGGILTGQFTPTEAGVIAVAYIVFFAIPLLNFRHLPNLPRDMAMTGLLYSIPLITIGGASAFGWMLAYLRGPAVVSEWIANAAGNDPVMIMLLLVVLFVIVGDFIDAIPAIIIFMPIIADLTQSTDINPVHM